MYRPLFPTRQQQRSQHLLYRALAALRPYMLLIVLLLGVQHEALGKPTNLVVEPYQENYIELGDGGISQNREDVMRDVKKEWRERFAIKSVDNPGKKDIQKNPAFGFMYVFYAFVGVMFVFALARQLQH